MCENDLKSLLLSLNTCDNFSVIVDLSDIIIEIMLEKINMVIYDNNKFQPES